MAVETQVDFYLLNAAHQGGRAYLACRLTEKAYRHGHRVYIQTGTHEEASRLDELLWSFSQLSFIPHGSLPQAVASSEDYPVIVSAEPPPPDVCDVLIPVLSDVPQHYRQFKRVLDPVGFEEQEKRLARKRYKQYRGDGVKLANHEIDV